VCNLRGTVGADDDLAGGVAPDAAIPRVASAPQGEAGIHDRPHLAQPHQLHHRLQILAVVRHVEILHPVLRPADRGREFVA
jgi:hypothetical protein